MGGRRRSRKRRALKEAGRSRGRKRNTRRRMTRGNMVGIKNLIPRTKGPTRGRSEYCKYRGQLHFLTICNSCRQTLKSCLSMRCMRNRYYGHIDISPMKYSSLMRYKYVIYEEKTKSVISIAELVVQIG